MYPAIRGWREVQEQLRLNKIYQGLRVSDDRPRYVFHGNISRHELVKRGRKTKALFPPLSGNRRNGIKIPGLKTLYRPIMGASPADYYLRANGTAATYDLATGPGSSQGDCMSITTHNDAGDVYLGDDNIYCCDDGGIFRTQLTFQSSGTSGHQIAYLPESGDSPKFYGSQLIASGSSWAHDSGSIYYTDFGATAPDQVWFSKSSAVKWGDKQASKVACTAEYDWYYDGSQYLYACSPSGDPDTEYDWVEGTIRDYAFYGDSKDYITVNDLEFAFAHQAGYYVIGGDYHVLDGTTSHHHGEAPNNRGRGIYLQNCSNAEIKDFTIHDCGYQGVFILAASAGNAQDNTIEAGEVYDCYHSNIDIIHDSTGTCSGHVVRYNESYFTSDFDFSVSPSAPYYFQGQSGKVLDSCKAYYNLARNLCGSGFEVNSYCNLIELYNNTAHGFTAGQNPKGFLVGGNNTNITLKNNIGMDTDDACLSIADSNDISACDYNCWYQSGGGENDYTRVDGEDYWVGEQATYKSATGFDAHGLWENPDFISSSDFHLKTESPCIEAGTVIAGLTKDKDGIPLGRGTNPDIGCFETLKGGPRRL